MNEGDWFNLVSTDNTKCILRKYGLNRLISRNKTALNKMVLKATLSGSNCFGYGHIQRWNEGKGDVFY